MLETKYNMKASQIINQDMSLKSANYLMETIILKLSDSVEFEKEESVRAEAKRMFEYIVGPWKGSLKDQMQGAFES